jgi:hypothetical protein
MGLDFNRSEAHWSYGGFHNFRTRLAACIGINLDTMRGFEPLGATAANTGRWEDYHDDILPLLYHSDCEGDLTPAECKVIAPRLRELVKDWPEGDYDKRQALLLADGMDICSKKRVKLIFT